MNDKYYFPDCMHVFAAGMHMQRIDPGKMVITLPWDDWWRLMCQLESQFGGISQYAGVGPSPVEFKYYGFTFRPADDK